MNQFCLFSLFQCWSKHHDHGLGRAESASRSVYSRLSLVCSDVRLAWVWAAGEILRLVECDIMNGSLSVVAMVFHFVDKGGKRRLL